jgi:hypothetical protein
MSAKNGSLFYERKGMKKFAFFFACITIAIACSPSARAQRGGGIFAPPANPTGPVADVMKAVVTAFNNHDVAYFQKTIAPDAVWFDEDGHTLQAMVWMNRLMSANPPRKLSVTNLRVGSWDNGGWAGFNYVLEGVNQIKGTNTMVFKKNGSDWQIAVIHGAVDTPAVAH